MVTYNKERTAYMRSNHLETLWYLVPRGKKRAPRWGYEGPLLSLRHGFYVDYITEKDREVLLTADDEGVFPVVLREVEVVLAARHDAEQERRRKVAQKIIDSYRRD